MKGDNNPTTKEWYLQHSGCQFDGTVFYQGTVEHACNVITWKAETISLGPGEITQKFQELVLPEDPGFNPRTYNHL